jgi:hypothetical protein
VKTILQNEINMEPVIVTSLGGPIGFFFLLVLSPLVSIIIIAMVLSLIVGVCEISNLIHEKRR